MNIDSHQHFWKYHPANHAWINEEMKIIQKDFLPTHLSPILQSNGIEGCVTVQVDQTEDENNFLLSLSKNNSFIKGIVGWVNLKGEDLDERLNHWREFSIVKGFRHIVQGEPTGFLANKNFIS